MKNVKTIVVVALVAVLSVANAHAWGKREQGILIGASAALILPSLVHAMSNPRYVEPVRYGYYPDYYSQRYYAPNYYAPSYYAPRVVERAPVVIYNNDRRYGISSSRVHRSGSVLTHRNARPHNYIHRYR